MVKIYYIFKQYKFKLLLIYLFMLLTELSTITQPLLLGKSIDGLISGSYTWLILLGGSYFISNFFNYKRMVYDTIVYTKIYNDIVFKLLGKSNIDESTKIARTDMANDIVHVLEGYVHYYISTIVTIIGSIGFIYSSNHKVGILVSFSVLFILLGVMILYKKIRQSVKIRNNHYENKIKSMQTSYEHSISFFNRKRKLDIYESTLQGKNWFLVGTIKYVFLIFAIVLLVTTAEKITVGSVVTIYSYVGNFLSSLMSIPVAMEMYSRLSDILKRVDH